MINSKEPLISVIMNCHNGSKFINRSVNSIRKQSYKNWELIFWDNYSTDSTRKVIKNIKDKRIKYFFQENFISFIIQGIKQLKKQKENIFVFWMLMISGNQIN